jgi:hypothetical protein
MDRRQESRWCPYQWFVTRLQVPLPAAFWLSRAVPSPHNESSSKMSRSSIPTAGPSDEGSITFRLTKKSIIADRRAPASFIALEPVGRILASAGALREYDRPGEDPERTISHAKHFALALGELAKLALD